VFLDGKEVRRMRSMQTARDAFRSLATAHDPPRPIESDVTDAGRTLMEEEVARFYSERRAGGREKGGRTRRK
jgi:hypothetical protein